IRREAMRKSGGRRRLFSHRGMIAVEAVLVVGILKDLMTAVVKSSHLPNWGKVLFVMALTVGVFGGLVFFVERFTERTVASTHKAVRSLPVALPYWLVHLAVLGALFLLYANHLGVRVIG